jgi:hypothetical protein
MSWFSKYLVLLNTQLCGERSPKTGERCEVLVSTISCTCVRNKNIFRLKNEQAFHVVNKWHNVRYMHHHVPETTQQ